MDRQTPPSSAGAFDFDDHLNSGLDAWKTIRSLSESNPVSKPSTLQVFNATDEAQARVARQERAANLGQMASHLAHEIRRELLPIRMQVKHLRQLQQHAVAAEVVDKLDADLALLEATVEDLVHFVSRPKPSREPVTLTELVGEVLAQADAQIRRQNVQAQVDIPADCTVHVDRQLFRRAVANLVQNALDAMPEGGALLITGYRGKSEWELEIADSGPGIAREERNSVFQPFYSTKGAGIGLGLSVVDQIVRAHGGTISVLNCADGGAAFTLHLPRQAQTRQRAA